MKPNLFNHTLLAVGVAAALGLSTGAMAATISDPTKSGAVSKGAAAIDNMATAVYSVGTGTDAVEQPPVESNKVTVNISETANFSLVAIDGSSATDEKNEDIAATPNTTTEFKHILANNGNVSDTYTIETTGNNSDIVTKEPSYALDSADIDYTIQPIGGGTLSTEQSAALSALGQAESGTISSGASIQLPPGLEAALSYQVATGEKTGGAIGVGTLTATSTFITTAEPTKAELINENQTIVTVPVFKIDKSATCQTKDNCDSFDLNGDTSKGIDYSIKVTNVTTDYSVTADNFVIRDVLPEGMSFNTNQTLPSGVSIVTNGKQGNREVIDITVDSLAVGKSVEIKFNVNVDVPTLRKAGSVTNHATVYDSYDNTTPNPDDPNSYDITDSTDDSIDSPNVPEDGDGSETEGKDTTPTITFTDRDISITDADNQEVPVKGEVTYTHTITNNGNENEGGTDRQVVIEITDPTDPTLSIDKTAGNAPYYSIDGGITKLPLAENNDGTYQLPDSVILVPNISTDPKDPTPGSTVEIGYTVVSDGDNDDIDVTKETNTITVKPGGDFAPTVAPVTNETTIQGLKLVKLAAVVPADGNQGLTCPTGTGLNSLTFTDGTTTAIDATPFDCIVYKVTATNTFTTKDLTDVTISDAKSQWEAQSTYQGDLKGLIGGSATNVTDTDNGPILTSEFSTLPSSTDGTMTFSIKVNP